MMNEKGMIHRRTSNNILHSQERSTKPSAVVSAEALRGLSCFVDESGSAFRTNDHSEREAIAFLPRWNSGSP